MEKKLLKKYDIQPDKKYINFVLNLNYDNIIKFLNNIEKYFLQNTKYVSNVKFEIGSFTLAPGKSFEINNNERHTKVEIIEEDQNEYLDSITYKTNLIVSLNGVNQVSYKNLVEFNRVTITNDILLSFTLSDMVINFKQTKINFETEADLLANFVETFDRFINLIFTDKFIFQSESAIINTTPDILLTYLSDLTKLHEIAPLLCDKVEKVQINSEIETNNINFNVFKLYWKDGRQVVLYSCIDLNKEIDDCSEDICYYTLENDKNEDRPEQTIYFKVYEVERKSLLKYIHKFPEKINDLSFLFFSETKKAILLQIKSKFEK